MLVKEETNHIMLSAQLLFWELSSARRAENMGYRYLITETSVPNSSATSGIAGMNEPVTKTLSHMGKKNCVITRSALYVRP